MVNTLRVQIKYTYSDDLDVLVRTYWSYFGTAPTNAQLDTFALDVAMAENTNCASLRTSAVTLVEVIARDLTSDMGAVGTHTGSNPGTLSGGELGAQTAFLVNYQIPRAYRGGKPRNYMPFGSSGVLQDAQHWTTEFVTGVTTGFTAMQTAISELTWSGATITGQVNVSYYSGFVPVPGSTGRYKNVSQVRGTTHGGPIIAPDVISSTTFSPLVATQRRRTTRKR